MNALQVFESDEFGQVRVIMVEGRPFFVGKDVAAILGYERTSKAILDHVDSEDKDEVPIRDSIGRMQNTPVINESGLFSLILASKMPSAKRFKRWVTGNVLPSIRKHGMYATEELLDDPDLFISVLQELKAERQKRRQLEVESAAHQQIISELQPKASYYDMILQNKSVISVSQIAKDYGMSAKAFNAMLHELGIQYTQGHTWLLYQQYAGQGYTQSRTYAIDAERSTTHTYWTQKGRIFLYNFLLNTLSQVPMIEQRGEAS